MTKPTDEDLETTRETLLWLLGWMEKHEPQAVNSIATLDNALVELPSSVDDLVD